MVEANPKLLMAEFHQLATQAKELRTKIDTATTYPMRAVLKKKLDDNNKKALEILDILMKDVSLNVVGANDEALSSERRTETPI